MFFFEFFVVPPFFFRPLVRIISQKKMSTKRESSSSLSVRPLKRARVIILDPHVVVLDCLKHYFQDLSHERKYSHMLNFHGIKRSLMRSMEFDSDWVIAPDNEDSSRATVKCRPSFNPAFEFNFPYIVGRFDARFTFGIPSAAAVSGVTPYIPSDQADQYRDARSLTRALLTRVAESIKGLIHDRISFKKAVSYEILHSNIISIEDSSNRKISFLFGVRDKSVGLFMLNSGSDPLHASLVLSQVALTNAYKIVAAYSETYKYPPNMRLAFRSCNPHLDLVLEEDAISYE
jgi:hypothetical protein